MKKDFFRGIICGLLIICLALTAGCSETPADPTPTPADVIETTWSIASGNSAVAIEIEDNKLYIDSLTDENGKNAIERTRIILPEIASLLIPSGYDISANEKIPEGTKLKEEYRGPKWVFTKVRSYTCVDENGNPAGTGKDFVFEDKELRLYCTVSVMGNNDSSFNFYIEITNDNNFDVNLRMDSVLVLDVPYADGKTDITTATLVESLDYSEGNTPVYFRRSTYFHEYTLNTLSMGSVSFKTEDVEAELISPFLYAASDNGTGAYITCFGHEAVNFEATTYATGTEIFTNGNLEGGEYGAYFKAGKKCISTTTVITFGAAETMEKALGIMKNSPQGRIDMEHADNTALVLNENFDGTELDDTLWNHCEEYDRQGGSRWRDERAYVDGTGRLVIEAVWDDEAGLIETGAIFTNGKKMFTKGYFEASIRLPLTKIAECSEWGAFWLLGPDVMTPGSTSKTGTEIDIVESFWAVYDEVHHGTVPNYVDGDIVEEMYGETVYGEPLSSAEVYDGEYHTFALEWNDDMYYFYVDNILKWETNKGEICEVPLYMILSVEAGPTPEVVFKSFTSDETSMYVDYVRIFENNPYIER